MDDYRTTDNYHAIMDLPVASNEFGDTLFHSLDWAKRENIVVVWDGGKGWMRGKGNLRYRVMPTGHDTDKTTFTALKSGKS